jgi:hypothetical protein
LRGMWGYLKERSAFCRFLCNFTGWMIEISVAQL